MPPNADKLPSSASRPSSRWPRSSLPHRGHPVRLTSRSARHASARPTSSGHAKDGTWFWPSVPRWGVCGSRSRTGGCIYAIDMMVAPLNIGLLLYVFALAGQGIVGAADIAGWSSDNKFSLMGALRAAGQMNGQLRGRDGPLAHRRNDDLRQHPPRRHGPVGKGDYAWGIFVQPVAFFLFFTAAVAENKRIHVPRSSGGGERARERVLHRVLGDEVRDVLLHAEYMGGLHELDAARHDLPRRLAAPFHPPRRPHDRLRRRDGLLRAPMAHWAKSSIIGDPGLLRQDARSLLVPGLRSLEPAALPVRPAHEARMEEVLLPASLAEASSPPGVVVRLSRVDRARGHKCAAGLEVVAALRSRRPSWR